MGKETSLEECVESLQREAAILFIDIQSLLHEKTRQDLLIQKNLGEGIEAVPADEEFRRSLEARYGPLLARVAALRDNLYEKLGSAIEKQRNEKRTEGADTLGLLSGELAAELSAANRRVTQWISPADVVSAIRRVADCEVGTCLLLQPGYSGYEWSRRVIPMVFLVHIGGHVRIRLRRGKSIYNNGATPAVWPELRGFPKGNSGEKLKQWATGTDGGVVAIRDAKKVSAVPLSCDIAEWTIPFSPASNQV